MSRRIDDAERRARLGARHHLAAPAPSLVRAVDDLVAVHSSDPVTVYLALWARRPATTVAEVEGELYDERTMVRLWGMRRTMFVVTRGRASTVTAAHGAELVRAEQARLLPMVESSGAAGRRRPDRWLAALADEVLADLAEHGPSAAAEVTARLPALKQKLVAAEGTGYAQEVGLSSRLLGLLAMEGRIVRGRPRGSWISSQYRWSRTEDWLGGPFSVSDPETARADLARAWLRSYGPASAADLKWWTGGTVTATRTALSAIGAVAVESAEGEAWVLADDVDPVADPGPWVALLPSLDPTAMGWTARDWYLDPAIAPALYDRSRNIGPTIWSDGRIVGGWGQGPDGTVRTRLLADVGREAEQAIASRADALTAWLDGTVVTPRFPTPTDRELRSGG